MAENPQPNLHALADFRYILRKFLHFSEEAATRAGLTPQQHQLLLQIAGAPEEATLTVAYLAERLALRHNSVVELCTRCETAGLILREADPTDRRLAILKLTPEGARMLHALSEDHAKELHVLGPKLSKALKEFTR
jgi:DNA-binding MarR family transcriptional regulator